ncbi:MAG: T9SS type A sorting domain-containing protein [Ferruginibacter sp.]|nr:T9SS type A sorting domain-containing protein [Ferruginibacter sp.]
MKKLLPLVFVLCSQLVHSQVTVAITKANFGIEADLAANFYKGLPQPAVDDWFGRGYVGTGQAIIDTTGAAAIVAEYYSTPATRMKSFYRLMRPAPYSLVNNRLVLDAIYHRDFHGDDSTVFASGSNKNGMSPSTWSAPVSQGIPDKNDVLDAFTHVRRAGPNATDSLWMFSAVSIENTTGSRYFDFELYQTDISFNRSTLSFSGYGPDAGHTTWVFDAGGNILTPGDIIFTAEFGTAGISLVEARIWINKASLSMTPVTFKWGGLFDGAGSGSTFGYANILPKIAGDFYAGIQSSGTATWAGPFALVREDNSVVTDYQPKQFMEFAVNLTKLGIEPAQFSNNACGSPFRRVLVKTRSSTSFTAELKDFIAPFKMFDYASVDANAYTKYFCETMPQTTVSVYNINANSQYTWSTINGSIVGSNTGTSITVDAPGTYYVKQQLHVQCPQYAMDSVTILYDAVCAVLNVDVRNLTAFNVGKETDVKWTASNNEEADFFVIEYSTDNVNFKELVTVPASTVIGSADYTQRFLRKVTSPTTFYRVRVVGKKEQVKYSNTVLVRTGTLAKSKPVVFPNPVVREAWISMESSVKSEATVYITDVTGRQIKRIKLNLNKGNNLLPLTELAEQTAGMYVVRIKSIDGETSQKVMITK